MTPQDVIARVSDTARESQLIRALFLSGSYGMGLQDEYSDLDFLAVIELEKPEAFSAVWRKAVEEVGPVVLWWDRQVKGLLINAITKDWVRIDVVAGDASMLSNQSQSKLKTIFDKDNIFECLPDSLPDPQIDPARLLYDIQEFIRILGLLPLAVGRNEMVNAVTGLSHLRRMLIELLILESGVPNRGGALNLNRLITPEQNTLLRDLPPLIPEREAIIKGYLAYADAFLPRAHRLTNQHGTVWPTEFEVATWAHLEKTLGTSPARITKSA